VRENSGFQSRKPGRRSHLVMAENHATVLVTDGRLDPAVAEFKGEAAGIEIDVDQIDVPTMEESTALHVHPTRQGPAELFDELGEPVGKKPLVDRHCLGQATDRHGTGDTLAVDAR